MSTSDQEVGLRAQDIQTGLQDTLLRGPVAGLFDNTRLVGMAERLAIHIRGAEVIDDYDRLCVVASRLGIDSLVVPQVLSILEEVEFVRVDRSHSKVSKVYEDVPYFADIYGRMGSLWRTRSLSEIEQASVDILQSLSLSPVPEETMQCQYGLDRGDFSIIKDVGVSGGYITAYQSPKDEATILYSPLFWEEHPEVLYALLKKYPAEEIAAAIEKVRTQQGFPIPELKEGSITRQDQILVETMACGLLPTPAVDSLQGKRYFAFTPYSGGIRLSLLEKAILQKARAILSCVRYGQHFGTITKIRNPELILNALEQRRRIGPHTEIARQYALLVVEGVGRIVRDSTYKDQYHFIVIDTEDNLKAIAVARDMLLVGEAITDRGLDSKTRAVLFYPGTVQEPLTTLAETRQKPLLSEEVIKRELDQLVDRVREGVW